MSRQTFFSSYFNSSNDTDYVLTAREPDSQSVSPLSPHAAITIDREEFFNFIIRPLTAVFEHLFVYLRKHACMHSFMTVSYTHLTLPTTPYV